MKQPNRFGKLRPLCGHVSEKLTQAPWYLKSIRKGTKTGMQFKKGISEQKKKNLAVVAQWMERIGISKEDEMKVKL